jgi:hypothetical protein
VAVKIGLSTQGKTHIQGEISGSHGREYEDDDSPLGNSGM